MYSKCTFRYVPNIGEVRGQGIGNFPLNYTDEKGEATLRRRDGTGTASTSSQIHQIAVLQQKMTKEGFHVLLNLSFGRSTHTN